MGNICVKFIILKFEPVVQDPEEMCWFMHNRQGQSLMDAG